LRLLDIVAIAAIQTARSRGRHWQGCRAPGRVKPWISVSLYLLVAVLLHILLLGLLLFLLLLLLVTVITVSVVPF
jgi:hypothetical protein